MGHNRAGAVRAKRLKRTAILRQESLPSLPKSPTIQQQEMYNRLVKSYYKQFSEGEVPELPPEPPQGADELVLKRYQQAKARYDRYKAKLDAEAAAREEFAKRPLMRPHVPVYNGKMPDPSDEKAVERFNKKRAATRARIEAALAKWERKMKERGYEV